MRKSIGIVLVLLATSLPGAAQEPTVRISEIYANPDGDREFIELWNPSSSSVDITGWRIEDAAGNQFTMPEWTLAADGRVVIWGGGNGNALGPAWSKATVWNNGGDTARLLADSVIDQVSYGSTTVGQAWHFEGAHEEGEPSPGAAQGAAAHTATAEVANVAPWASLDAPTAVAPDAAFAVNIAVGDDNGADDLGNWTLWQDGAVVASNRTPAAQSVLLAPANGLTELRLHVVDKHGAQSNATAIVEVQAPDLQVIMPPSGVRFPTMVPGEENVTSNTFEVYNAGLSAATPRIDISDFKGPVDWSPEGRLWVGHGDVWTAYDGPLTPLPTIAANQTVQVQFKVHAPIPLPSGSYGTSFTVVP